MSSTDFLNNKTYLELGIAAALLTFTGIPAVIIVGVVVVLNASTIEGFITGTETAAIQPAVSIAVNAWLKVAIFAGGLGLGVWGIEAYIGSKRGEFVPTPTTGAIALPAPPSFGVSSGLKAGPFYSGISSGSGNVSPPPVPASGGSFRASDFGHSSNADRRAANDAAKRRDNERKQQDRQQQMDRATKERQTRQQQDADRKLRQQQIDNQRDNQRRADRRARDQADNVRKDRQAQAEHQRAQQREAQKLTRDKFDAERQEREVARQQKMAADREAAQ